MNVPAGCRLGAMLALVAACTTVHVVPDVPLATVMPSPQRPPLDFDFHQTGDPRLVSAPLGSPFAQELDGEELAEATVPFRDALLATAAFAEVTRAAAGRRLHCEVQMRRSGSMFCGGILCGMSMALIPDLASEECEVVALVSAPGREPRTYRAAGSANTWLWLPLLPIGIVQSATQRTVMQQTVDAIVAQMAQDGWLRGK